jgi:hypothetical protein
MSDLKNIHPRKKELTVLAQEALTDFQRILDIVGASELDFPG